MMLTCSLQGILRLRGRPTVAYDQQGLVFAVAMEGGAIKLFDSRSYDKVAIFCNEMLLWIVVLELRVLIE